MSSAKPVKKKIVVTKQQPTSTSSRKSSGSRMTNDEPMEMLFKRKNFYFLFAGLALMALGMLLMAGGKMPSPEIWDENLIYSPRRIIVAPIIILGGLGVVLYSIFKK